MTQVRLATISHYRALTASFGCDPAQLLAEHGFDPNLKPDYFDETRIEYAQVERLLEIAALAAQREHFGALLGSKQSIEFLGPLALVLLNTQSLRQALATLEQLFTYHVREGAIVSLSDYGHLSALTYTVTIDLPSIKQTNELAMAEGVIALKAICGNTWQPHSIKFTHKKPKSVGAYQKIFKAPVYFNQERTEIIFDTTDLDKPIANADHHIEAILRQQIAHQEKILPDYTRNKIEAIVRTCLLAGDCSLSNVAQKAGLHKRSLQRALKNESTSLSSIIDNVRCQLAIERLKHSDLSIVQIASLLGYADSSTFNRAFKRWHGISPVEWRKKHCP